MNAQTVIELVRGALMAAFWIGLPLLAIGFLVGIVVSLVQIVTSLQDPGFAALPRLIAFGTALVLLLPWMVARMTGYTAALLGDLTRYAR